MAFQGQYQDAAKAFARAGSIESAINMFADLRQWEEAKVFAASSEKIDSRERRCFSISVTSISHQASS